MLLENKHYKVQNSGGGRCGGWGLRLVAVAGCGASGRSVGSGSARKAALGSLAGLPRFSGHADVHRWRWPALGAATNVRALAYAHGYVCARARA